MWNKTFFVISTYLFWLFCFLTERILFIVGNYQQSTQCSIGELLSAIRHSLPMDLSMSGYFVIPTWLLVIVSVFTFSNKWSEIPLRVVGIIVSVITSIVTVSDLFLYPYWGFRLDVTPLFYLESPKNAAASATVFQFIGFFLLIIVMSLCLSLRYVWLTSQVLKQKKRNLKELIPLFCLVPIIVLVMRGGVTVSTMNPGKVYFSEKTYLNHVALNANWTFMYSLQKVDDYSQYYVFDESDCEDEISSLLPHNGQNFSIKDQILNNDKPNIILVIMEGFGATACALLDGEDAMPGLSKIASEGVFFDNFYANSFRTDRGLASILASYPGMPITSLMKLTNKSQNVTKFPLLLKNNGYNLSYYYGGDINFTNMNSFLMMCGYEKVIKDTDFPISERTSKWGVHDHVLFDYVSTDLEKNNFKSPFFLTLQSSSSHEPFDVPFCRFEDKYLNSVAYSDSCLYSFIDRLKNLSLWDSTLVIILPDHAAKYLKGIENSDPKRYHIPMIWTGGAIDTVMTVHTFCSQIDLGATLLSQLEISCKDLTFSKNIFARKDSSYSTSEFAFFAYNNGCGYIDSSSVGVYDYGSQSVIMETDTMPTHKSKVFMQFVYKDLEKR